jgi:hypothetical protein
MTTIGYARVSTTDQDLEIQIAALKREGCTTIRSEKRSGLEDRSRLGLQGAWRESVAAVKAGPLALRVLRPLSRTELVEFRMTVNAAICIRDANVSAPIPHKFKGLLDGRRSRVPFERHCTG